MKKIFKCFVLGMVLLCCVQSPIFASDVIENQKQYDTIVEEVFQDGSYLESYVVVSEHAEVFRSSKKTGTKTYTAKTSSGKVLWKAILHASYTYTGTSAKCISTSLDTSVLNSNWKITKTNHYASGSSAIGQVTAKKYIDMLIVNPQKNDYFDPENIIGLVFDFIGGEPFLNIDLIDKIMDYTISKLIEMNSPLIYFTRFLICTN